MAEEKREVKPICPCSFTNKEQQKEARMDFLRKYGDNLPEDEIIKAVSDEMWCKWVESCDCNKTNEIVAAARYTKNDWYLCTLKNLAVRTDYRKMGHASTTSEQSIAKALGDKDCLVLAADVTFDNIASLKPLQKAGFETVGEFCWSKGQKPADILHLVKFKSTKDNTCLAP